MATVLAFPDTLGPDAVGANGNSSTWSALGLVVDSQPARVIEVAQTIDLDEMFRRFAVQLGGSVMVHNSRAPVIVTMETGTPGNTQPSGTIVALRLPDAVGDHYPLPPSMLTG